MVDSNIVEGKFAMIKFIVKKCLVCLCKLAMKFARNQIWQDLHIKSPSNVAGLKPNAKIWILCILIGSSLSEGGGGYI